MNTTSVREEEGSEWTQGFRHLPTDRHEQPRCTCHFFTIRAAPEQFQIVTSTSQSFFKGALCKFLFFSSVIKLV